MFEFKCISEYNCGNTFLIKEEDDPTSSTGCCKMCGSSDWILRETDLTEQAHFKQIIKGHGTVTYNILEDPLH